jgi:bifunctional DNA-binding transcriptional regulator/antitoxin component of YhaV-PrlF toxin-antitoxin module
MSMKLQLRKVDGDVVIILPQKLISLLTWGAGDIVDAKIVEDNLIIRRDETSYSRAMKIARKGMERYRSTFEKLAKN